VTFGHFDGLVSPKGDTGVREDETKLRVAALHGTVLVNSSVFEVEGIGLSTSMRDHERIGGDHCFVDGVAHWIVGTKSRWRVDLHPNGTRLQGLFDQLARIRSTGINAEGVGKVSVTAVLLQLRGPLHLPARIERGIVIAEGKPIIKSNHERVLDAALFETLSQHRSVRVIHVETHVCDDWFYGPVRARASLMRNDESALVLRRQQCGIEAVAVKVDFHMIHRS
jgi:hypothetical protein